MSASTPGSTPPARDPVRVTDHATIVALLRQPGLCAPPARRGAPDAGAALGHAAVRRTLAGDAITRLEPLIHATARQLLDELATTACRDLTRQYALPLVTTVIAQAFAVPQAALLPADDTDASGEPFNTAALIAAAAGALTATPAEADPHPMPLIAAVVEETLRLTPPVAAVSRTLCRPSVVGSRLLPAGTALLLDYAAANRDPAIFTTPERWDPTRPGLRRHLAFGTGRDRCPGAALAQRLATIALEELIDRTATIACQPPCFHI